MLINVILLCVVQVSAMSTAETDVNIIPEFPVGTKAFEIPDVYYRDEVDLLLTKLPSRFTLEKMIFSYDLVASFFLTFFQALLLDPIAALENPETIYEPITTCIFEARRDNVRSLIPQVILTVASLCKEHGYAYL